MSDICREPSDKRNTAPAWMRLGLFRERATAAKYDDQNAREIMDLHLAHVPTCDIARMLGCSYQRARRVVQRAEATA